MRSPTRFLPIVLSLLAAGSLAPAPARAAMQQTSEERERERERAERDRERERERAERERERARERAEQERERARDRAERERARDRGDDYYDGTQGPTRIDTVVSVGRDASVDLSLVSGNVTVTAWGRGDVQVRGYSERLPLRFEHQGGRVRVWVPNARLRGRSGDQRLEVVVPVGTRVAAQSVSGNVRVTGVRGELEAGTVSGDVDASDGVRRVALNSVSGAVRGTNVEGDVRANSVSGEVILDQVSGEIDAQSVSGEVEVRRARSSRLRMESVSGELTYEGSITRDGRYELNSHSGEIHLLLPADVGADLSLRTFSGSIDTDFPLTTRGDSRDENRRSYGPRERRMDFTLGGGGARIMAETFSGSINIGRAGTRR
jgi:Ni/Co efflux regulator RcnB